MSSYTGFYFLELPLEVNLFAELEQSAQFEATGKGRWGNHLVRTGEQGIPMVRTTTQYNIPPMEFAPVHERIIQNLNRALANDSSCPIEQVHFNNALIEVYTQAYFKMKYHSDQALDLATDSFIALFSCYEDPANLSHQQKRKLKIRNKTTLQETTFVLEHNSVILFSTATNTQFSHKIVLEPAPQNNRVQAENRWLGITFRQSKTFVHFESGIPYFTNGKALVLADQAQRKEFYTLRGQENRSQDFIYPSLNYTLSIGDTLTPQKIVL